MTTQKYTEKDFYYFTKKVPDELSAISHGTHNGYVVIPSGHPWYAVSYHDIPLEVHGGLTFSAFTEYGYTIGFDTCHYNDNPVDHDERFVLSEIKKIIQQLVELGNNHE